MIWLFSPQFHLFYVCFDFPILILSHELCQSYVEEKNIFYGNAWQVRDFEVKLIIKLFKAANGLQRVENHFIFVSIPTQIIRITLLTEIAIEK